MAFPKAILCTLGNMPSTDSDQEAALRAVGFATASIGWKEVASQQNGFAQLVPVLDDPSVNAWVIAGAAEDFTEEVRSKIALITLSLTRALPPATAMVLTEPGEIMDVPASLGHIRVCQPDEAYPARLMAARVRPPAQPERPFFLGAHLDPLVGQWLEIAPPQGAVWKGFLAAVLDGVVTAFGTGVRGTLPAKSTMEYPQLGIKGDYGDRPFTACAAMNALDGETSVFLKVEGSPTAVLVSGYPDEVDGVKPEQRAMELIELV